MKKFCLFLAFLLVFTLAGCGSEPEPVALDSPAPAAVTLDTCALTSLSMVIETETGYYAKFGSILYYADKSDLSNWVPVCNNPGCSHLIHSCPACSLSEYFLKNGRFYSLRNDLDFGTKVNAYAVYSMNPDGTDLKQEYIIEETNTDYGGGISALVYGDTIYVSTSIYQVDGTCRNQIIRAKSDGYQVLQESTSETMLLATTMRALHGDLTVKSDLLAVDDNGDYIPCRVEGDTFTELPELCGYEYDAGYLSGSQLNYFRQNDGYYIADLSTGKTRKWMDAQLSNSQAAQFNGQYILESNMRFDVEPDTPRLRVYDGETWHEVTCPEGIWKENSYGMEIYALSTEHIFFKIYNHEADPDAYCISYADGSYALQYCGSFE